MGFVSPIVQWSILGISKATKSSYLLNPLWDLKLCSFSLLKIRRCCDIGMLRFVNSRLWWINQQLSIVTNFIFPPSHCATYLNFLHLERLAKGTWFHSFGIINYSKYIFGFFHKLFEQFKNYLKHKNYKNIVFFWLQTPQSCYSVV